MGSFLFFAFSWWAIALRVVALVHFIKRRPDFYWLWVILFHWVGALVYIVVEVIPDAGLLRGSFQAFPRRKRIRELQAIILDNPSAGNYEELALLYLESLGRSAEAREWAQRILNKKPTMPGYLKRRERPWFRRANAVLGRVRA